MFKGLRTLLMSTPLAALPALALGGEQLRVSGIPAPERDEVIIRVRKDGSLREYMTMPKATAGAMASTALTPARGTKYTPPA